MNSSADMSERLDELESRLAFQDDLIEQLNDVIARQDREVLALVARVRELEAKLNDLAAAAAAPPLPTELTRLRPSAAHRIQLAVQQQARRQNRYAACCCC